MSQKYDFYKAEYIWVDGTRPTYKLRSKAKVVPLGQEPPIWAFDGSSTQQATGDRSDCVLKPVFVCEDPIRGEPHKLVMCEVFLVNGEPHPTNTRAACREVSERYTAHDTWFGLEQEYTFFDGIKPLGWPNNGFPAPHQLLHAGDAPGLRRVCCRRRSARHAAPYPLHVATMGLGSKIVGPTPTWTRMW